MANLDDATRALIQFYQSEYDEAITKDDITYDSYCGHGYLFTVLTDDREYWVMTEDETEEANRDYTKDLVSDIGIFGFHSDFTDWIIDNALDDSYFEERCREDCIEEAAYLEEERSDNSYEVSSPEYDIDERDDDGTTEEDYSSEVEPANRLIEECIKLGIIDADELDSDGEYTGDLDLGQEYAEQKFDSIYDEYSTFVQWYRDSFSNYELADVVRHCNWVIDYDVIADEIARRDGYGGNLASYDGKSYEEYVDGELFYIFRQN